MVTLRQILKNKDEQFANTILNITYIIIMYNYLQKCVSYLLYISIPGANGLKRLIPVVKDKVLVIEFTIV